MEKKKRNTIDTILIVLVIAAIVRQFMLGNYHDMFLGVLTLALFAVPMLLERIIQVTIPATLKTVIFLFIFCAEILGEMNAFFVKVPIWDTILHTTNGFLDGCYWFRLDRYLQQK